MYVMRQGDQIYFIGWREAGIFTVMERETAFGHICAKHSLDLLNPNMVSQMVERTVDGVDKAVLDKGLKGYHRKKVEVALRKLDVEIDVK